MKGLKGMAIYFERKTKDEDCIIKLQDYLFETDPVTYIKLKNMFSYDKVTIVEG